MPDNPATAHGSLWQTKLDPFLAPRTPGRPPPRMQPPPPPPPSAPHRPADVVVLEDDIEDDDDDERRRQPPPPPPPRPLLLKVEAREEQDDEDVPVFRLAPPPPRPHPPQLPSPSSVHALSQSYPPPPPDALSSSSSQSSLPSSSSQSQSQSQSCMSLSDAMALKEEEDDDGSFRLAPPPPPPLLLQLRPPLQRAPLMAPAARERPVMAHTPAPTLYPPPPPSPLTIKDECGDDDALSFRLIPPPPRPPHAPAPADCLDKRVETVLHPCREASVPALPSVKTEPKQAAGKENREPPSHPFAISRADPKASSSAVSTPGRTARRGHSAAPAAYPSSPPPLEASTQLSSSSSSSHRPPRRSASMSSISSASSSDAPQPKPTKRRVKRGTTPSTPTSALAFRVALPADLHLDVGFAAVACVQSRQARPLLRASASVWCPPQLLLMNGSLHLRLIARGPLLPMSLVPLLLHRPQPLATTPHRLVPHEWPHCSLLLTRRRRLRRLAPPGRGRLPRRLVLRCQMALTRGHARCRRSCPPTWSLSSLLMTHCCLHPLSLQALATRLRGTLRASPAMHSHRLCSRSPLTDLPSCAHALCAAALLLRVG